MSPQFFFYVLCWPWIALGMAFLSIWACERYGEIKVIAVLGSIVVIVMIYLAVFKVHWS